MSLLDKINRANLSKDSRVTLTYEEGTDVWHFNETHVETALEQTSVASRMAMAITSGLDIETEYCSDPLESLRESQLLDEYDRGSYAFEEFVTEALVNNFYDADLISESTERFDHKRGFTTLTARVTALVEDMKNNSARFEQVFSGWTAEVQNQDGKLTFSV